LAIGYWLLAIGYWLLAIGYWLLAIGLVIIYMISSWYGTNPLRVSLIISWCLTGYSIVVIGGVVKKSIYVNKESTIKYVICASLQDSRIYYEL